MPAMTIQEITKCQKNKTPVKTGGTYCRNEIGTCQGYQIARGMTYVLFKEKRYPHNERWIPPCDVKVATEEEITEWQEGRIYELEYNLQDAISRIERLEKQVEKLQEKHKHWWSWK